MDFINMEGVYGVKIPVSFKKDEIHIYNYIRGKRNYSDYIKDLVEADMKKSVAKDDKAEIYNKFDSTNNSMEIDI